MRPIIIESKKDFQSTLKSLENSILRHNMVIVSRINAQENLKKAGFNVPGSYIFEIFRPDFANSLLSKNMASGIEPPLRLYVYEENGKVYIEYYRPTEILKKWEEFDLGILLDNIFESIISDTLNA